MAFLERTCFRKQVSSRPNHSFRSPNEVNSISQKQTILIDFDFSGNTFGFRENLASFPVFVSTKNYSCNLSTRHDKALCKQTLYFDDG